MGQLKGPKDALPRFAPSARFDLELELGAIVCTDSFVPFTVDEADQIIFGYFFAQRLVGTLHSRVGILTAGPVSSQGHCHLNQPLDH